MNIIPAHASFLIRRIGTGLCYPPRVLMVTLALLLAPILVHAEARQGMVVDANGAAIAGATVTVGSRTTRTDLEGRYQIDGSEAVQVRAPGYARPLPVITGDIVRLTPLLPKALYLTVYGIGAPFLRDPALEVIQTNGLNALVIDLKGDRGLIPYPSALPLAGKAGAMKLRTIPDLKELVASLKARNLYLIARIVVFKDDLLVGVRPDWAVRRGGAVWKDREGLAWVDPFVREAWGYSLAVAEEAAAAGFDEIQFDYVRFPDATGLAFSQASSEATRVHAITSFLREARQRLMPYNVFTAVDVFGYVCWNYDDTGIGQRIEDIAAVADYISPMLYPSSFHLGIPGYRNPVQHPYEIVKLSLDECKKRTAAAPAKYRPWLQAFTDYAFGGQKFSAIEIGKQIDAARDAGTVGWMLWNPRNVYSNSDFRPQPKPAH